MTLDPSCKMSGNRMEKYTLRKAFNDPEQPKEVLWRLITLSKKVIKRYKVLSKKCITKSIFHLKNESARFCIKDAHSSVQSRLLDDDGQMVEDHKVILAGSGH